VLNPQIYPTNRCAYCWPVAARAENGREGCENFISG